jgi:hypothetical protein
MLTTRDFQHISLGKEGVPSVTRFMSGAEAPNEIVRITSERPGPSMPAEHRSAQPA